MGVEASNGPEDTSTASSHFTCTEDQTLDSQWQDTEVLKGINNALNPLSDFTDAVSGEQYVSVSSVKPVLHLFETSMLAIQEDDTDFTKSLKTKILGSLQEKYRDPKTQDLLDIASTLNPRFKMNFMRRRIKPELK